MKEPGTEIHQAAETAVDRLAADGQKLVLAESCTAGLVAAALGAVPGVSRWFCGSLVTYRAAQKTAWLGVPEELLARFTPESPETAEAMARGALERTPEATLVAAITGHLGPEAPPEKDGWIFIAVGRRGAGGPSAAIRSQAYRLESSDRQARQRAATKLVLEAVSRA